jgi:tRNA(His) 5'-end guanylyltransferase
MKGNYEDRDRHYLMRRTPVIVRVDGRAFHSWTRGLERPFDQRIIDTMVSASRAVAEDMQGCKAVYVQSDEASFLLTDFDKLTTEAWFNYNQSKVESISAALMTAWFNLWWPWPTGIGRDTPAIFDARAFNVPLAEVSNYFLWRMKDWERNSVSMYCQAHFSHKQLHGKQRSDQHELLHSIGKNWATDLSPQIRNGTLLVRGLEGKYEHRSDVQPTWPEVDAVIAPLLIVPPSE